MSGKITLKKICNICKKNSTINGVIAKYITKISKEDFEREFSSSEKFKDFFMETAEKNGISNILAKLAFMYLLKEFKKQMQLKRDIMCDKNKLLVKRGG